ncbi:MAG: radical SAM family heme chaperone HemW [bacterium]
MNIYIHIPFCHSKCAYCAFLSHCDVQKEDEYVDALCEEIKTRLSEYFSREQGDLGSSYRLRSNNRVETVYFGGGTPSLLKKCNISKIIQTLNSCVVFGKDIEITLECNPEDITKANLISWKESGVNRLSIGVQTLNNDARSIVGRELTSNETINRIVLTQKYFTNIGIDIISGLPGESTESLLGGIEIISNLGIDHISFYDLEINQGSQLSKTPQKFTLLVEDTRADMLIAGWQKLSNLGYKQYEISNFTSNKHNCRHNLDFWKGRDYHGFGLGATSRLGNQILTNTTDFELYLLGNMSERADTLSAYEINRMNLLSAMRLLTTFKKEYRKLLGSKALPQDLIDAKYITTDFRLTPAGKLVYNLIVNRLVLDE